jgi:hypothetical protein
LNTLEKFTKHLGFDPTTETGILRLFEESTDWASRVLPFVRIKEIKIIDLDSEWYAIVLEAPNHQTSLEVYMGDDRLLAAFERGPGCPATLIFSSGTLGRVPHENH